MTLVNKKAVHQKKWIIGVDEVGRGPLAGPVTVAAVAAQYFEVELPELSGIRDSKKCTRLGRERWDAKIRKAFPFAIVSVSEKTIDRDGIMRAVRMAVSGCLAKLAATHAISGSDCMVLLDGGLCAPIEYKNQKSIIKGDELVPLISAASIIAKVSRDAFMTELHALYPVYGFDQHKGYGTRAHAEAIREHGLSAVHRKSFCKNLHYADKMI